MRRATWRSTTGVSEPGQWELAAVAFVASRHVDLQPWWDESADELWRECGFHAKPPYNRVWERLRELGEERSEAFLDAAALVIQRCRAHDPRVFAHTHVDSTEDETHAALVHDCQPGDPCQRSAKRPRRADTSLAREQREEWNEQEPTVSEKHARETEPERRVPVIRDGWKMMRVRLRSGCWYLTRDTEAGVRKYANGRFWHGYYSAKLVDHLTGGVVPSVVSASTNESDLFPALFDRAKAMVGGAPETVTGDRGFSVEKCFEHATRSGTAPVFPWPKNGPNSRRHDELTHDWHGVKRCRHCGGEMKQKRFAVENGTPYLWFKCVTQRLPECGGEQRIRCETNWRSLIPLSRLEPLYHELKASHQAYEGVHDYWRDRYRVAADTLSMRPKAVGLDWHRLRANVACLIDWLRIAAVNGWLGSVRAVKRATKNGVRTTMDQGVKAAAVLANSRSKHGLDLPYGPKAKALGLGEETPPSRRPRVGPLVVGPAPLGP